MILYYVNNSDRTEDVAANSLKITNQIANRANSCSFAVFQGTKPTENQDIKVYDAAVVLSQVGATIVLKDTYQTDVNAFRAGQELWLKIGDASMEKGTVLSYVESTRTIVLTAAPSITLNDGDNLGELIFGGIIASVEDDNIGTLDNIQYEVSAVGFEKIFDKKLVTDTWQNVDARYIINSFLNSTVNFTRVMDSMSYVSDAALRAVWIESSDGGNPSINASDFLEGTASAVFPWTYSGGTARWSAAIASLDVSQLVGVASGAPTKGFVSGWVRTDDFGLITSLKVRVGSDSSNYALVTLPLRDTTDWQYVFGDLDTAAIVGTPVWTARDYGVVEIVQTASGSIQINGLRINAAGSFTAVHVQGTGEFSDIRSPQVKPIQFMNTLAKPFNYQWWIDFERDIHFVAPETVIAPYEITDESDNFTDLSIKVDASQLGNRIIVRGGEKVSDSTYAQVYQGDGVLREWLMKNKFQDMAVLIDDNTSTDTMEATTSTTTVKATAHGLAVGDHIVNRTRSVVREVITVPDADTFTVLAVPSQASGDTFSKFATTVTLGVEGFDEEGSFQYMQNSNEKSVRAAGSTNTLPTTSYIRFAYKERLQISTLYFDPISVNALKALGYGDGIFDLDTITDRNITDVRTAVALAAGKVSQYSNAVVSGEFKTDQKGLRGGQLLHIMQTVNRNLNDRYVIQSVTLTQTHGRAQDYFTIQVRFATTLFGWEELIQKLLSIKDGLEINTTTEVETYAVSAETVHVSAVEAVYLQGDPWQWEPSTGQALATRWGVFEWG